MGTASRWGVALLLGVLVIAVHRLVPDKERELAPLPTEGSIGRPVDTGAFTIEVEKVTAARAVARTDPLTEGPELDTAGIWVLVWATATAQREPLELTGSYLVTGHGERYAATTRLGGIGSTLDGARLAPGIPRYGAIVFELPARRLAGARLSVSDQGPPNRLGYEARIDLGIDERKARALAASAPALAEVTEVEYR